MSTTEIIVATAEDATQIKAAQKAEGQFFQQDLAIGDLKELVVLMARLAGRFPEGSQQKRDIQAQIEEAIERLTSKAGIDATKDGFRQFRQDWDAADQKLQSLWKGGRVVELDAGMIRAVHDGRFDTVNGRLIATA